ncbi:MAG: hypothetical protein COA96_10785, partial [SAR86 cluster bacterium]
IIIFSCLIDAFTEVSPDSEPGGKLFREMMTTYSLELSYKAAIEWDLPERMINALKQQRFKPEEGLSLVLHHSNMCSEAFMLMSKRKISYEDGLMSLIQNGVNEEQAASVLSALRDMNKK